MSNFKIGDIVEYCNDTQLKIVSEDQGWFCLEVIKEGKNPKKANEYLGYRSFYNTNALNTSIQQGIIINTISI